MYRLKSWFRRTIRWSAVVLLWAPSASYPQTLPAALAGRWQVAEVHINTAASRTPQYGWNDPALRWRIFTFSPAQEIDDTPEATSCQSPHAKLLRMKLGPLMADSLAGGYGDDPLERATPVSYELTAESGGMVEVISLSCRDGLWHGDLGADGGLKGAWMYLTPNGHLVLRWYDETLLVLDRLKDDALPQASFACARAASPTEKAICSSLQLASFDRSVASAYGIARDQAKVDAALGRRLLSSQKAWVAQRNACGSDAACILASMKKRLGELAAVGQE